MRIASNMEPCAGIDEGGIPALQHIAWIYSRLPQSIQSITDDNQKLIILSFCLPYEADHTLKNHQLHRILQQKYLSNIAH